jgi:hypothetical protein
MRIKFKNTQQRELYFEKKLKNNFISWQDFSKHLDIDRKLLLEYRKGKLTIPNQIYQKLIILKPKDIPSQIDKQIEKLNENWGKVKGGINNYKKNQIILEKGRQVAIKKSKEKVKKFNINIPLSKEISYIIGLYIGDGFSNKYQRHYLTQFTGHSSELDYYKKIVTKRILDFSNISPKIKLGKGNFLRVNYYSKYLYDFFIYRFKIKSGRKSKSVQIPKEILDSSTEIKNECIAGLYDAEGSFYFDKREIYKNPYPILEFNVNNQTLCNQISQLLKNQKLKHSLYHSKIYIYNKKNIKHFLKIIKIKNKKLIDKIPNEYLK